MKIIDLLNKIANGEIYSGTHVIYRDREYIFTGSCLENTKEKSALAMFGLDNLNNEVEIIEENKPKTFNGIRESYGLPRIEDKKIEKIKILNCDNYVKKENYETILTMQEIALDIQTLKHKVNEIIDKLNSMVE